MNIMFVYSKGIPPKKTNKIGKSKSIPDHTEQAGQEFLLLLHQVNNFSSQTTPLLQVKHRRDNQF